MKPDALTNGLESLPESLARSLGRGGVEVLHLDLRFDPSRPLRSQLSALTERLLELRLRDGRRVAVGWWPERSPGGAFRLHVDGREELWADDWSALRAALATVCAEGDGEAPAPASPSGEDAPGRGR